VYGEYTLMQQFLRVYAESVLQVTATTLL